MAAFYWGPHVAVSLEKPVAASAPRSAIGESAAPAMSYSYLGPAGALGKEFGLKGTIAHGKARLMGTAPAPPEA
jgi:hypothetical protein